MNPIILGSGPAGLTAAIYLSRANLSPILIHGPLKGGQLTLTTHVENFPGFSQGILGPDLMQEMLLQAERFGTIFQEDYITEVDLSKEIFTLKGSQEYSTKSLIIATGSSPKYLNLPLEKELLGSGLSTCATCDGFFYKNKIVYIVGGGDTAMEEASHLSKFAQHVFLVHRSKTFRASYIMQNRVLKIPNISCLMESEVIELHAENNKLSNITIKNPKGTEKVKTDGLFYAIGHSPNTSLFKDFIHLDNFGYILTESTKTSKKGVFAAGDVQDPIFRQAITSAGSGCQAAMLLEKYLHDITV
jgi:thioredoxin reductase (NADPH)